MLVQVVADYGLADLANAEVRQRLALHVPGADVVYTPVGPFDTLAAGFCVAQLALGDGARDRIVYHNVAPRQDDDNPRPGNEGERLLAGWVRGALVVGVDAGHTFSFLRQELDDLIAVAIPDSGSQFRSRDVFPPLLPRLLARDPDVVAAAVAPDTLAPAPEGVVAYVDGYGNLKTTWADPPVTVSGEVQVRIGGVTGTAIAGEGTFDVPAGQLAFAPGSSGWTRREGPDLRWWELLIRGGSAYNYFDQPPTGTQVELVV